MIQNVSSFFTRIFRFFFPYDDVEAIKKRRLKELGKEISKNRFGKWYKPHNETLQPAMGVFFYEIYKTVGPARPLLSATISSKVLKNITVEQCLSKDLLQLRNDLLPEAIYARAKSVKSEDLVIEVRQRLKTFLQEFDEKKIEEIDAVYNHLYQFIYFVLFDYYFFLKKFDPALPEDKFSYIPKCTFVNGVYLQNELKDFAEVFYGLSFEANWEKLFGIIVAYKNVKPVNMNEWKKLVSILNTLRRANILEKIIGHIGKDPSYQVTVPPFAQKITSTYLMSVQHSAMDAVKKVLNHQKNAQAAVLVKKIFTGGFQSGTKYYHPRSNEPFEKRGLDGYIYASPMNYLKAFLLNYFKGDIRALFELILVRGQWLQPQMASEYSESYHILMQLASKITEFDEKLSAVSDLGVKFRTLLSRMEREKKAGKQAERYLQQINEEALRLLQIALRHMVTAGKTIKSCIADYDRSHRELLKNWKEIEHHSDKPVREWMAGVYTKIYHFIMLEQVLLK